MPKTILGQWSVKLIVLFLVFLLVGFAVIASGQRGGEYFFSNLLISIPMVLAGICGLVSFFTGLISIVKNKERGILVFVSTLVGLFVLFFISGEILSPH